VHKTEVPGAVWTHSLFTGILLVSTPFSTRLAGRRLKYSSLPNPNSHRHI
jgi:hypothetical protein